MEIIEAYNLALRQMVEKRDWENGLLATDDLVYWTPGQTIKNVIRTEAGHTVGKTKLGNGLAQHFLDCFKPSLITTYGPVWDSVKFGIWKEIKADRQGKDLPGRVLETCEIKIGPKHFARGKSTNDSGGTGTERVQGEHQEYMQFQLDEAEGISKYVFDAVESMRGGGIVIVLMWANPRTRTSEFHRYASLSYVQNFRISCLNAPNVVAGREVVPNAVRRDYVLSMVEKNCEPVAEMDEDRHTFTLPYPASDRNSVVHPAGTVWEPEPEFCWRVLGLAPSNLADNTFVPVGRYEAAKNRKPVEQNPHIARIGIDVARYGADIGTVYARWNGRVWRHAHLAQQDTNEYYRSAKKLAIDLKAKGVTHLHIRVDGGGGFGSGVIDQLKKDAELRESFVEFRVLEVHFGGEAYDKTKYRNLGTEMLAEAGESIKALSIVNPPEALEADLCERTFHYVNLAGEDVKQLDSKEEFRKDKKHRRSPDDGDGFVLAVAPDFIFRVKPSGPAYNPAEMVGGFSRRR